MKKFKPVKKHMRLAIRVAEASHKKQDYSIGAIVTRGSEIVALGYNHVKQWNDSTRHAEMMAIHEAVRILKRPYLKDCTMYTTHEPCPMCAGASVWAMLGNVVYATNQLDMLKQTKLGDKFKWRTIDIKCSEIYAKTNGQKPRLFKNFLRDEALHLFKRDLELKK